MSKELINFFRENQPISLSGALLHTYRWFATINRHDRIYINDNINNEVGYLEGGDEQQNLSDSIAQKKSNTAKKIAIYCVHGTADFPWAFNKIAHRLVEKGLTDAISAIHLVSFEKRYQGKDMVFFAEQLLKKIIQNGDRKVILIGHSRGGIINSYLAEQLADQHDIEVKMIFNICSPFDGSYLAKKVISFFSASIGQMAVGCEFLKTLNCQISMSNKPYYFFAAQNDSIVNPLSTFNLDYVKKNPDAFIIYDRHGHLSILSSHRLVSKMHELITTLLSNEKCKGVIEEESKDTSTEVFETEIVDAKDRQGLTAALR